MLNSARARPKELSAALDALAGLAKDPDSLWYGRLDLTRTAAAGHSFGGGTALALAGAPLDTRRFPRPGPMPDPNRPEFLDLSDARVRCALAFTPGTDPFFSDESLAKLARPVLILDGDRDPVTPPNRHGERVFRLARGPREYGVLRGAGHLSFFDPRYVEYLPWIVRAQHWPTMPDERAEELIRAATLSFLDRQLRGGTAFPARPTAPDLVWRLAP